MRKENAPLDEHKQSKRGNQQTMQEPLNKRKTGNMIYEKVWYVHYETLKILWSRNS